MRLSSLALLCRRHYRLVHEDGFTDGFTMEGSREGELRFRWPNGWLLPPVPPMPGVEGDAAAALARENGARGLEITPRTALPGWLGEGLDVGGDIRVGDNNGVVQYRVRFAESAAIAARAAMQ